MPKYKLIDIGRNKINCEVDVKNDEQLAKECFKHLMSSECDIHSEDGGKTWVVTVGMGRSVGRVERIDEVVAA